MPIFKYTGKEEYRLKQKAGAKFVRPDETVWMTIECFVALDKSKRELFEFYLWTSPELCDRKFAEFETMKNATLLRTIGRIRVLLDTHNAKFDSWLPTAYSIYQEEANRRTNETTLGKRHADPLIKAYVTVCENHRTVRPTLEQLLVETKLSIPEISRRWRNVTFLYNLQKEIRKKKNLARTVKAAELWTHVLADLDNQCAKALHREERIRRRRLSEESSPDRKRGRRPYRGIDLDAMTDDPEI